MQIYWNIKTLHKKRFNYTVLVWNTKIAAVSLLWDSNMADVTSCVNSPSKFIWTSFILQIQFFDVEGNLIPYDRHHVSISGFDGEEGDLGNLANGKTKVRIAELSLVSLRNRTSEIRGRQNVCVWRTWQCYYLRALSWSSLKLMFSVFYKKDLFKGRWSLEQSFFKQNYCHACHTRFANLFPLPSCCWSSLLFQSKLLWTALPPLPPQKNAHQWKWLSIPFSYTLTPQTRFVLKLCTSRVQKILKVIWRNFI